MITFLVCVLPMLIVALGCVLAIVVNGDSNKD